MWDFLFQICVMKQVPVSFEWEGKIYIGHFKAVSGSGANVWHLVIDGYYWGQLWLTENYGWQFANSRGTLKDLTCYFADIVANWNEDPGNFLLFFTHSYN